MISCVSNHNRKSANNQHKSRSELEILLKFSTSRFNPEKPTSAETQSNYTVRCVNISIAGSGFGDSRLNVFNGPCIKNKEVCLSGWRSKMQEGDSSRQEQKHLLFRKQLPKAEHTKHS